MTNTNGGCQHRATLIVTHAVPGTASNVAKRRLDLKCRLAAGHSGQHRDSEHGEAWTDNGHLFTTVLRDESEEPT